MKEDIPLWELSLRIIYLENEEEKYSLVSYDIADMRENEAISKAYEMWLRNHEDCKPISANVVRLVGNSLKIIKEANWIICKE